ncbi:MAG: hypothetical protein LBR80_03290 [Deltaproteobacteria bacterium]|jgi:hypothetical protein|nr:hypothetical protein [Deltaproteobacteria bacterium]
MSRSDGGKRGQGNISITGLAARGGAAGVSRRLVGAAGIAVAGVCTLILGRTFRATPVAEEFLAISSRGAVGGAWSGNMPARKPDHGVLAHTPVSVDRLR